MSIVEFDRPPSWSLNVNETGEYKMPMGSGSGVNSVGVKGQKNRETVTASLCLVFTALVAPAKATPDWSKGK